jgi:hypothetical protein
LGDSTYTYTFENRGTLNAFDITEATSQLTGAPPTDFIDFIAPKLLQPGESTTIVQEQRIDYCQTTEVSATVKAKAKSSGEEGSICSTEIAYSFIPAQAANPTRRVLRGN